MQDGRITEDLKDLDLGISKTSDPLSSLIWGLKLIFSKIILFNYGNYEYYIVDVDIDTKNDVGAWQW